MRVGLIQTETELEDRLSAPTPQVIETLSQLDGDLLILGVAGKMGPSLARMARRACDASGINRRVIGVSRFTAGGERELEAHGVETSRCDLMDRRAVEQLPKRQNVVYMAGRKFGSTGNEALTWAANAYLPALICEVLEPRRVVAFSTGNVYGLVPVDSGGSRESDPPAPAGEYAMSCLGRERLFEHFSRERDIPMALIRLNYACDLRYGVLVDVASKVWRGVEIDVTMGYVNTIWQGDANAMTLSAFGHVSTPPWVVNVTGPERLSIRSVARAMGARFGKPARCTGRESPTALLSNPARAVETLGAPMVSADTLIEWVADWVARGGRSLHKPTHFESRDGRF